MRRFRAVRAVMGWLPRMAAALAIAAQLGTAIAPVAEGQAGRSSAPHVEVAGISSHYAHNDASCATCQARSLTGMAARPAAIPAAMLAPIVRLDATATRIASQTEFAVNNPRAPPTSWA